MQEGAYRSKSGETVRIADGWSNLTWEQLVWMHSEGMRMEGESEVMWKWRVWMHLAGMEMFGGSYLQNGSDDQTPFLDRENLGIDDMQKVVDFITGAEDGRKKWDKDADRQAYPVLICLFRRKQTRLSRIMTKLYIGSKTKLPMGAEITELYEGIKSQTKWINKTTGLTKVPAEYIWIGRECYRTPDPLLTNLTYEQYSNCQHTLQEYWEISEKYIKMSGRPGADKEETIDKEISDRIMDCQCRFTAHILTKRRFQLMDTKDGIRLKMKHVWAYDSDEADDAARRAMTEGYVRESRRGRRIGIPILFGILYRVFQSSLEEFRKMYPNLFTAKGGGGGENPLTMEIGTLNAVMKYGGYANPNDVYESNAVIVFKWMDSMSKEAKEMDKITKKTLGNKNGR